MADQRVKANECQKCGAINDPSKARCWACHHNNFHEVGIAPKGKIITHTTCSALPERIEERSEQTFAFIQLRPGWRILAQIKQGQSVQVGEEVVGEWKVVSKNGDGSDAFGWVFQQQK